ncbi:MAG: metalloenzyme [Bdellovibrionota bacterium]|nr:MAG: metalloenzyme [Bdellovibrionota bacterium]
MKNNLIFIVFDSCRFDTFAEAHAPRILRLGEPEKRYSYASWTVPSHTVYMMGASPHTNPRGVFASEVYKKDFVRWADRLNIPDISFKGFVPHLSLPAFLKAQGYQTNALVSMPVLNQTTNINRHFDRYQLMKSHNDFNAIIDELEFDSATPSFYLLNIGETHYPYTLPGEGNDLPIIHGMHGVFKHMDDLLLKETQEKPDAKGDDFFNMDQMLALKEKQRKNVEYLDGLFDKLYQKLPSNTHVIVTSDHGELFGEDGFFGHGPVIHEKVFEVFFVEGRRP